jgi:phosphoribosyl 1,2-cyclic phosphate phosphodiesterase
VDGHGARVLVDTSPDLREQLLDAQVRHLDAVVYTHGHADHVHGIDDLREVNRAMRAPLPIHGTAELLALIASRFGYVLGEVPEGQSIFKPMLLPHEVIGPFAVGGLTVVPFTQDHGYGTTLGLRFGPLAYSTDVVELDEAAFAALDGVDTWIIGCLADYAHPTHADVDKVLAWVERVTPRRAVLTHMSTRLDYDSLKARLPAHVEPAYDGMVIEVPQ